MDNTKYIALSRQMALWKQMDIVSNNMANMNTSGYKQDDAVFSSYLVQTPEATGFGRVRFILRRITGNIRISAKEQSSIPAILLIWHLAAMFSSRLRQIKGKCTPKKAALRLMPTVNW